MGGSNSSGSANPIPTGYRSSPIFYEGSLWREGGLCPNWAGTPVTLSFRLTLTGIGVVD